MSYDQVGATLGGVISISGGRSGSDRGLATISAGSGKAIVALVG